jgi:hypothetical protein
MMTAQDAMKAGLAQRRKSTLVPWMRLIIGRLLRSPIDSHRSNTSRVTTKAVNIETAIPMESEMPKPFTDPVPRAIRSIELINVVRLASKMVQNTLS